MWWLILGLIGALSKSVLDFISKKIMHRTDEYVLAWSRIGIFLPVYVILLFIIPKPQLTPAFWGAIALGVPFEVTGLVLYLKAIKASPLSITIPMLGMTPIFLLFTSFVLLREVPSLLGLAGIVCVAAGTYVLGFGGNEKKGIFEPWKNLLRQKGPMLMLIVAFIYSITSANMKVGINNSDIIYFGLVYFTITGAIYMAIMLFYSRDLWKKLWQNKVSLVSLNLVGIVEFLSIAAAFTMALVTYSMAVKRASILFSVLLGLGFLGEKHARQRIVGAVLVTVGIALVAFA